MTVDGWHYFIKLDVPDQGQKVTLSWNDGTETDVVWQHGVIDWSASLRPVAWKELN